MRNIHLANFYKKTNQKFKKLLKFRRGISPIIATILLLGLVTMGVLIGFLQIVPYMERTRAESASGSVQGSLLRVDNTIWNMINEGGIYLPDSTPSQTISLNLPTGFLSIKPNDIILDFQLLFCTGNSQDGCNSTSDFFDEGIPSFNSGSLGILQHRFTSSFDLISEGSIKYLSGSNPNLVRDIVAFNPIGGSTSAEQSATNLILYKDNLAHFIDLFYRPKVSISQTIENGNPTYNIGLFLINLTGQGVFTGTTSLKLNYKGYNLGTPVIQSATGVTGSYELHIKVNDQQGKYASVSLQASDTFTTQFKLSTIIYNFEIST